MRTRQRQDEDDGRARDMVHALRSRLTRRPFIAEDLRFRSRTSWA